jgi:RNA polymerase sigma-70 factor, ECF subfamily
MDELYARGRQGWPELEIDPAVFASFVGDRLQLHGLERLHAADLYLACGCASGERRALALLEAHHLAALDGALARVCDSAAAIDDVKQLLRVRFLTRADDQPLLIAAYSGLSELRNWLRVAGVRLALTHRRKHHREVASDDALIDLPAREPSPELDLLKRTYRAAFTAAFTAALAALDPRERNLLRHQALDGLSIDRIGAFYGVHRATAARWIAAAREALIRGVRRELRDQLGVPREQLDSILQLVRSGLDVSLRQFLGPD